MWDCSFESGTRTWSVMNVSPGFKPPSQLFYTQSLTFIWTRFTSFHNRHISHTHWPERLLLHRSSENTRVSLGHRSDNILQCGLKSVIFPTLMESDDLLKNRGSFKMWWRKQQRIKKSKGLQTACLLQYKSVEAPAVPTDLKTCYLHSSTDYKFSSLCTH